MKNNIVEISCKRPNVSPKTSVEGKSYLFEDKVTVICPNNVKYEWVCAANAEWVGDRDESC